MEHTKTKGCLNSLTLKLLAMALMLCDHLWATVLPGWMWLTDIGRIAFPIFAFQVAEGFQRTHDRKKYLLRMLVFALISEIPFNYLYYSSPVFPFHQNVMFTFFIALLLMLGLEKVRSKGTGLYILAAVLSLPVGYFLGTVGMVDYYGTGVLTIFIFYFFRGRKWWCLAGQLLALYWVNVQLLGGLLYPVHIFGMEFEICQQGLALLALLPIWLYRGRQGYHSKPFQYACYAFYPVHMLILVLILQYLTR